MPNTTVSKSNMNSKPEDDKMKGFKKEILEYLNFRLERLTEEKYKDTGSFYSDGLKNQALIADDALGSFEIGFDSGDLRGQYDSYMTLKLMIEKL